MAGQKISSKETSRGHQVCEVNKVVTTSCLKSFVCSITLCWTWYHASNWLLCYIYPEFRFVTPSFFLKMGQTRPLFRFYFRLFQTNNYNSYNKYMWKMWWPSSIQCRASNPWPSGHESPPITTRPGLPRFCYFTNIFYLDNCLPRRGWDSSRNRSVRTGWLRGDSDLFPIRCLRTILEEIKSGEVWLALNGVSQSQMWASTMPLNNLVVIQEYFSKRLSKLCMKHSDNDHIDNWYMCSSRSVNPNKWSVHTVSKHLGVCQFS